MVSNFTSGPAIMTPEFRLSFPNVFTTSAMNDGKPSFNMVMLFPKSTDLNMFRDALRSIMKVRWGEKLPQVKSPFINGDTKNYAGYEGMIALKAANYIYDPKNEYKARPGIVDANLQPIINPSELYPGCWCRATIIPKATGGPGTTYAAKISFGIRNIQKLRDDDAFGTTPVAAQDDFEVMGNANADAISSGSAIDPSQQNQEMGFLAVDDSDDTPF